MLRDLFAVHIVPAPANFRLPALPRWDLGLCDFEIRDRGLGARRLHGYVDFWTDFIGGPAAVAQYVRASFDGSSTQDRKVVLFAATLSAWPHTDLLATYPTAFGCSAKAAKLATHMADGGAHPADPTFAAGREEDFARGLASAVKAHLASGEDAIPRDLRWSLLMLLQAYAQRRRRPSAFALYALAGTLGLLDRDGHGRNNLALAGVIERRALIERAAARAFEIADDGFEFDPWRIPDERADQAFEGSPIFWLAMNDVLRRLGEPPIASTNDDDDDDRMQIFGDLSAADS